MKNHQGVLVAKRMIAGQVIVTILSTILLGWFCVGNSTAMLSAILGGFVSILPTALFAGMLFRHHGARATKKIVSSFYRGEAAKIMFSMAMFAGVFSVFTVNPIVFFVTYILAQMIFWLVPVMTTSQQQNRPEID